MRIAIAIHDPPVWTIPPAEVARLASLLPGDEVVDARDPDARKRAFAEAEILFATRISAEEFAGAGQVRWMHSSAVGVGGLLPPPVVASPVVVSNSRGVHSEAIAEHAIALVLALRRQLYVAARAQIESRWAQAEMAHSVVAPLAGTRLLVVGLGTIGARVAQMGAGLGMRVDAVRRHVDLGATPGVDTLYSPDQLRIALAGADAVVLAAPRTEETRAMIGADELRMMKPTALLVNVARGRLTDEAALADALANGRLGGAGLDAFHDEPLPGASPLWRLPNVVVTPHTASFSGDYWRPVVDLFVENLGRYRRGEPLVNVVDKRLGY
jgi:phosphoglycerate dehydrogenase-like enzyme